MTNLIEMEKFISSTEWARNFAKYLEKVKEVKQLYVIKNSKPEAVVLDVHEYNRLTQIAEMVENVEIAAMLEKRSNSNSKYSLSEAIDLLGFAKEDLNRE